MQGSGAYGLARLALASERQPRAMSYKLPQLEPVACSLQPVAL